MGVCLKPKKTWKRRLFLSCGICGILFFLFTFGREFLKNYEVSREIANLQKQADNLAANNAELAALAAKINTLEFLEKEARTKFGLQKDGERAAIIISNLKNEARAERGDEVVSADEKINNLKKWWLYFFGYYKKAQADTDN
jgi:cell division protein FtsB